MTMAQTMKIETARIYTKLFYTLFKLKIISEKKYRKLINYLTIKTLAFQMKEDKHDNSNK